MPPTRIEIPPKCLSVLASPKRHKVLYGGRGGAKSWSVAPHCLVKARARLNVLCVREFQNSIQDSVHRLLSQWIANVPELAEFYQVQKTSITGRNGSEFIFRGMKKETAGSVKSLESVDICWVEEAQYLCRESLDILIPTIRKPGSEFIWTLNPTNRTDPVYQDFVLRDREDTEKGLVSLWDNPYASAELLQAAEMDRENEDRFRHVWLGECRSESSQNLISERMVEDAIGRDASISGNLVFGVDVARFGDDSSVCVARKGRKVLWVKRWKHITPLDLSEQVSALAMVERPAVVVVDEVGLGVGTLDPMKRQIGGVCKVIGFNGARKADNDLYGNKRAESWGEMKEWLKDGSLPQGEDWAANISQVKFYYGSRNRIMLEEKSELRGRSGFSPDLGDALAMSMGNYGNIYESESITGGSFWA